MKRINIEFVFALGAHLHALEYMFREDAIVNEEILTELVFARFRLESLVNDHTAVFPSPTPVPTARAIIGFIDQMIPASSLPKIYDPGQVVAITSQKRPITGKEYRTLSVHLKRFKEALSDSLAEADIFHILPKGAYSTRTLLVEADRAIPDAARPAIPPIAIQDIKEAGKCLAFECATASGFHILRAVECVMTEYIVKAQGIFPNDREWYTFIIAITNCGGSRSVTDLLTSIRVNYRNPLMHPEDTLTSDDALGLFGLCTATIGAMISELKTRHLIQ